MIQGVKPTDRLIFDLKMLQIDYNDKKKEALRHTIAEKYGVPVKQVEVNFIPITVDENGEKMSLASNIINDIQDPKFQVHLFEEYVKLKNIEDVDMEDIKKIDSQVNAYVDFDSYSKFKSYKIKYMKWDNYLSYGKGNYMDFTKLHGLVLLNGMPENMCGKTTFAIDLLRFALFGKADKSPTLDSVFNIFLPEETEVMVEAGIEIDNVDYVIRRTITRPALKKRTNKSKCKQKVEYFKLINGNYELIENYEAESTQQTNNIIRESIGSVEDFNLVISATAYSLGDLLRMGQSDKGKLFSRWLGLMSIEKKEEIAKELWKKKINTQLLSNSYNKTTLNSEIDTFNKCIEDDNKQIIVSQDKLVSFTDNIEKLNKQKTEILLQRKEIKESLIKEDVTTIENNIASYNNDLTIKRGQFSQLKDEYKDVKDAKFDIDEYNQKRKHSVELEKEQSELRVEISHLKEDNKRIEKLIANKVCPTCSHPIEVSEQNTFIDENNKKIQEFINKGVANKTNLDKINLEIAELEKQREMVDRKQKIELKLTALKSNIELFKSKIAELTKLKEEIETNKENIKLNNDIDIKIRNVEVSINTETRLKEQTIREIEAYKNEVTNYQKNITDRKKLIEKLDEEEKVIRNWKLYQQLVGKDGIVKIVLRKALPIINNEIKRLLNGLCDFDVELSVSDDNKVCLNMLRDGKVMDLSICASGYETTMASIALRTALCSISSISRPNFCTMDEIIGTVGISNYDNLHELFKRMCSNYQFILHVSHVEAVWDWHEQTITVTKDENTNVSKLLLS